MARSELLEPFQKDAITEAIKEAQSMNMSYRASIDDKFTESVCVGDGRLFNEVIRRLLDRSSKVAEDAAVTVPLTEAELDVFPCLLVHAGSTTTFLRIEDNGTFQLVDCSLRSGKSFIGIGKMLTGCQTFDELVDMASKGNKRNVDQYSDFFTKTNDGCSKPAAAAADDDWYSTMFQSTPFLCYGFGTAADSDPGKLSPEDVAHAWLSHSAAELVRSVQHTCHLRRLKRVFFSGGFCNRPFVRQVLAAEFVNRLLIQLICDEVVDCIDFDFIKAGEFLGALGCAVADLQHASK
jgi:pantothenate kinase